MTILPNWCFNSIEITPPANVEPSAIMVLWKLQNPYPAETEFSLHFLRPLPRGEWDHDSCVEKWGTKWDLRVEPGDVEIDDARHTITIHGASAWSPPIAAMHYFAVRNPEWRLSISFQEPGCDFMGHTAWAGGTVERAWSGACSDYLAEHDPNDEDAAQRAWDDLEMPDASWFEPGGRIGPLFSVSVREDHLERPYEAWAARNDLTGKIHEKGTVDQFLDDELFGARVGEALPDERVIFNFPSPEDAARFVTKLVNLNKALIDLGALNPVGAA